MRRLNFAFLASLRLCAASKRGFSIHSDLLAYPQYDVVFSDEPIAEQAAESLLKDHPHRTYSASPGTSTNDEALEEDQRSYELMSMAQQNYLCSIPILPPNAAENKTADDIARAEEDRKRIQAAADGWNLLSDLEHTCLYFTAGWWTYSFCKNTEIVQYHALPAVKQDQPPQRDPRTAAFTLGREPAMPDARRENAQDGQDEQEQHPAELLVTDDHNYLVQKLEHGDVCDLTGRERTIEVRYECMPNAQADRIGYIKEVAICAYLMVIHTPKLCKDVAFLPREEPKANAITCRLVVENAEAVKVAEIAASASKAGDVAKGEVKEEGQAGEAAVPLAIGGTVVGGRKFLSAGDVAGQPPTRLGSPKDYFNGGQEQPRKQDNGGLEENKPKLIAQRSPPNENGKLHPYPTKTELEAMEVPYATFLEMEKELEQLAKAGKQGWRIEAIRTNGIIELIGHLYPNPQSDTKKSEDELRASIIEEFQKEMEKEMKNLIDSKDEIDEALKKWKKDGKLEAKDELPSKDPGELNKLRDQIDDALKKWKEEDKNGFWDVDQYDDEDVKDKKDEQEGSEERFKDEL